MEYITYCKNSYKNIDGFVYLSDKKTDTQVYVKRNDGEVTIVFRGTSSMKDWRYDFEILRRCVPWLGNTFVHSGFLKQYNSVRSKLHLLCSDAKKVIVCGHSLGGALATICSLDMKLNKQIKHVSCLTLGSPRVGGPRFVSMFNDMIDKSYRFVCEKDPVTFTPLPLRFRHVKGAIHLTSDSCSEEPPVFCFCGCQISHHSTDLYATLIAKKKIKIVL